MNKLATIVLVAIACMCFYFLRSKKREYRTIVWIIFSAVFAVSAYLFFNTLINRINNPQVWDFNSFYLWGKVAVQGYNFYLPESSHVVFNSLNLPGLNDAVFTEDILNVGFLYPPPTILYFAPLGFLSYQAAFVVWTLFNFIFFFGSMYLVYVMFLKSDKINGILLIITLFFLFSPVRATVFFSQTNFILLFLLLLMRKYFDTKFAGIFLALAFFTKPFMIIFLAFFILIKNWKAIVYFVLSAFSLTGLTFMLFGITPFTSYFFDNPSKRLPQGVFFESINQSLHSVLLRGGLISDDKPLLFLYITIALLIGSSIYLIYLNKRKFYDYIWAALLLVGLILYPGTLGHYEVLLLFIIFQFFNEKTQLGINAYLSVPIISIFYFLSHNWAFLAFCFLLGILILKSFKANISIKNPAI